MRENKTRTDSCSHPLKKKPAKHICMFKKFKSFNHFPRCRTIIECAFALAPLACRASISTTYLQGVMSHIWCMSANKYELTSLPTGRYRGGGQNSPSNQHLACFIGKNYQFITTTKNSVINHTEKDAMSISAPKMCRFIKNTIDRKGVLNHVRFSKGE